MVRCVHPGAAIEDRAVLRPEHLILPPQRDSGFEAAVRREVPGEGRADSSGNVPCLWIDGLGLATVSLTGTGIDQRHATQGTHLLEIEDTPLVGRPSSELTRLDCRRFGFERFAPGLQTTIEHRLRAMAEVAEEEPQ